MRQRGSNEAFPRTCCAGDNDILVFFYPGAVRKPKYHVFIKFPVKLEVYLLKGRLIPEPRPFYQQAYLAVIQVVPLRINQMPYQFIGGKALL